jgi:hypothetical protein
MWSYHSIEDRDHFLDRLEWLKKFGAGEFAERGTVNAWSNQ